MSDQPDALRVADALEVDKWHVAGVTLQTAADLLREQHAEIERLRYHLRTITFSAELVRDYVAQLSDDCEAAVKEHKP